MSNWDRDLSLELISEFETCEILWDPKNKFHYNNVRKEDAWTEIGRKLKKDVDEVKKKMESLRGSYRREKNRVKTKRASGKGRMETYVSKWFAYEHMKFLDNRGEAKALLSNLKEDTDVADNELESSSSIDTVANRNSIAEQPEKNHADEIVKNKRKFVCPKSVRCAEDRRISEAYNIIKNAGFVQKDECSAYGEFIATKLRKFDDRSRAQIQHQFNDILYEAEMGMFYPECSEQDPLSNSQVDGRQSDGISTTAATDRPSSSLSVGSSQLSPCNDSAIGTSQTFYHSFSESSSDF